jgi:HAD superfamily hydrolase (TIGR01450 family)
MGDGSVGSVASASAGGVKGPDLVDGFDALLFDLDGVIYVGPEAVPHAAEVITAVYERAVACIYVTNNAARPAEAVSHHLAALGIAAAASEVITSPQAAVSLLPQYVAAGAKVLVIGGDGIVEALEQSGYVPVRSLEDGPQAVIQGYSPDLAWRDLAEATFAVRTGLPWIATNPDLTFPTPRGIAPGNGSLVQVVAGTVGREPDAVAGKPEPPLLHEAIRRAGSLRPLMIGDRLDTDIAAGARVGIPSLLVFTGVTTFAELVGAVPLERPTYLGGDLRVLLEPYPVVRADSETGTCGQVSARVLDGAVEVQGVSDQPWDGLRAVAALAWRRSDLGRPVDTRAAVEFLRSLAP